MPAATRRTSGRPTLRDVAALAGVSLKTASRVVNDEGGVTEAKTEAVRTAVRQLDYRRNYSASSLRRADGRTAAVGALLEDLANPFSAEVYRALEDVSRERGSLVFAASLDEDPRQERAMVRELTGRRVDALVIAPATEHQGYLEQEVADGTPVVFVDRRPTGFDADAVVAGNTEGARTAVDHLVAHGHRRIAFLGDLQRIPTAAERYNGYAAAMANHGLVVDAALVHHDLHGQAPCDTAVARLLDDLPPDRQPTALFTAQNVITVAAVRGLQARGREREVALVGFDDFPLAELVRPGITVIAQDPRAIGLRAAQILFARRDGDTSPSRVEVIETRLVQRGTGEIRAPR